MSNIRKWEAVEVGCDEWFLGLPDGQGGYDPFIDLGDMDAEQAHETAKEINRAWQLLIDQLSSSLMPGSPES